MHLGTPYCFHCGDIVETTLHVLRDCPLVMLVVWMNLVPQHLREGFFTAELHNWITINIEQPKWSHYWATTVHALWEWRNKALHYDDFVMFVKPWEVICSRVKHYYSYTRVQTIAGLSNNNVEYIRWKPPDDGSVRLNTDGASKRVGFAGCGGVLRGDNSSWICGFMRD
ncbi:hypothetical protein TSUD_109880 [Trifolium subterraneum]|uniref:Reverse transcriptase zinc-binding domain-containing protein n=1 Tax=Trifolium subterraneum TaxID=3900 RepID=A0A2Z6LMU8_TRISU|nr:hypothetical protein TSUD_109880 [Trifolium subterraneum]